MTDNLDSISLSRLHMFLAICDTLHLARAAEQIGVTQSALSQKLRGLEEALGVRLFDRRHRRLELSSAGKVCQKEAERILTLHNEMINSVRLTARGLAGCVDFGYVPSVMYGQRLVTELKAVGEKFSDLNLSLHQHSLEELLPELEEGHLDVALMCAPVCITPDLEYKIYARQELLIALPRRHPLARLKKIPVSALATESLIAPSGPDDTGITRVIKMFAESTGTHLQIQSYVPELNGVLAQVSVGQGYSIVPGDLKRIFSKDVIYRQFREPGAWLEYWLVWRTQSESPAVKRFIKCLLNDRTES